MNGRIEILGQVFAALRPFPRRGSGFERVWFAAIAFAFLALQDARANHTHMHGGPFIGVVLSIAVDAVDPNTLFVVAHGGGVFRSKNGGVSWQAVNDGLPNRRVFTLLLDSRKRGHLYLGTDDGLFASENDGNTWRPLPGALAKRNIRSLVADPLDPGRFYVATDRGVFVGAGRNWKRLHEGLPHNDVRVVVADRNAGIIAGAFGGVYRLGKSGDRWQEIASGLTDKRVRDLSFAASEAGTIYAGTATGGVFKTTNGGESWHEFNRGLLNSAAMTLLHVPSPEPTLYVGTVDGIFASKNGENRWRSIGDKDLPFTVSALAHHPREPRRLFAGSGGRLYLSRDGGNRWRESISEINYFSTVSRSLK